MSFRLAAYAVCTEDGRVLLAYHAPTKNWTLPGGGVPHQSIGISYQVRIVGGQLRPEPQGEITESVWTPIPDVAHRRRSSLADVGLTMAQSLPPTGHVPRVPIGGLIRH
jgi:8-oxo-dGTP diphosphatase